VQAKPLHHFHQERKNVNSFNSNLFSATPILGFKRQFSSQFSCFALELDYLAVACKAFTLGKLAPSLLPAF